MFRHPVAPRQTVEHDGIFEHVINRGPARHSEHKHPTPVRDVIAALLESHFKIWDLISGKYASMQKSLQFFRTYNIVFGF